MALIQRFSSPWLLLENPLRLFLPILLFLPLIEIAVMVMVGQEIGVAGVLLWLILDGIVGVWLMRWQGGTAWRRVREAVNRGEVPVHDALDGFSFVIAGVLLVLPGFVSDIAALLLLLPPVRHLLRRHFQTRNAGAASKGTSGRARHGGGPIIDAEEWVVEEEGVMGSVRLEKRGPSDPHSRS